MSREVNIRLGTWYLANLSEEYQEVPSIVAAYNAAGASEELD